MGGASFTTWNYFLFTKRILSPTVVGPKVGVLKVKCSDVFYVTWRELGVSVAFPNHRRE